MMKQNVVEMTVNVIPEPVLRRLPVYYQYLRKINLDAPKEYISCARIAEELNTLAIQVRKDMAVTGAQGRPRVGYKVIELIKAIEIFLGWNNASEAYLIGAGNLGSALLGYQGFKDYGLNIIAAFDVSADKIGSEIYGKKVLSVKKLPDMIKRTGVKIGILTASASCAQELTDIMVNAGIKAIWNFAPVKISAPEGIIVQHENLASSLAVLSKRLALLLAER
ncbi:MAG: redox-sensing transcriptional repressor Rex [Candidatus Omnitrophota bacterium]